MMQEAAMIPIGTLCLVLGDHSLAGRTCTVAGPLAYYKGRHKASGKAQAGYACPIKCRSSDLR